MYSFIFFYYLQTLTWGISTSFSISGT